MSELEEMNKACTSGSGLETEACRIAQHPKSTHKTARFWCTCVVYVCQTWASFQAQLFWVHWLPFLRPCSLNPNPYNLPSPTF